MCCRPFIIKASAPHIYTAAGGHLTLTTAELETTLLKSLPAKLHLEISDLLSTTVMREDLHSSERACHCMAYCFLASGEGPAPAETSTADHAARARMDA